MSDEVECSICIDFFSSRENDSFVTTSCGHLYHRFCLDRVTSLPQGSKKCPSCRGVIKSVVQLHSIYPQRCIKKFKITSLGDVGVGKTCLLRKYCDGLFTENISATVGWDQRFKTVCVGEEQVKLAMVDTAGQEMFKSISPQMIRGSQGIVLVYDTSHNTTLEHCQDWFEFANLHAPNAIKILLGAKNDLTECIYKSSPEGCHFRGRQQLVCRPPTQAEVEDMATHLGVVFFETSAKMDYNVDIAFRTLVGQILQNRNLVREARLQDRRPNIVVAEAPVGEVDRSCCKCSK